MMKYLTNIPQDVEEYGFCKTLLVRREVIHIKHILTEVFDRQSIDINKYINKLDISLFDYMKIMTNRLRDVHHFSRNYTNDINEIVKSSRDRFFPTLNLYQCLNNVIILDFDGVVTDKNFRRLYELCISRCNVIICSANPTITEDYFIKNNLSIPNHIYSCKGKVKKINTLIYLQKIYDYVFYVDNEIEYLEYAWLFGLQTFHYTKGCIKYFSLKTK